MTGLSVLMVNVSFFSPQRWSAQPLHSPSSASSSCLSALSSTTSDTFGLTKPSWRLSLESSSSSQVDWSSFASCLLSCGCPLFSSSCFQTKHWCVRLSGLALVVGLVLYISSINDEMLNRTKSSEAYFTYKYGWSFAFAAFSFLLTEVNNWAQTQTTSKGRLSAAVILAQNISAITYLTLIYSWIF